MKIIHITSSLYGGAGIAAQRLNSALHKKGIQSSIIYLRPYRKDICGISHFEKKINGLINVILNKIYKGMSFNIFPSRIVKYINSIDADIVHLHWINAEMLSINQLCKINKPIVWTFHDMWAMCSVEHYSDSEDYVNGYKNNLFSINNLIKYLMWNRKRKIFSQLSFSIISPSQWMHKCVQKSYFFKNFSSYHINNCLSLSSFRYLENKSKIKDKWDIPKDKKILTFGAAYSNDPRKGYDLMINSLEKLKFKNKICLVVFGKGEVNYIDDIQTKFLGEIRKESDLNEIYNCSDVICIPSRKDNLPNVCLEAKACRIPIVAFKTSGLVDLVNHKIDGYLAESFNVSDFANGIEWVINNPNYDKLSESAFESARNFYSEDKIALNHQYLYETILKEKKL